MAGQQPFTIKATGTVTPPPDKDQDENGEDE